jgi:catechol 2,3-dioxygenase-like lactoylglutathione lyase family enzyme
VGTLAAARPSGGSDLCLVWQGTTEELTRRLAGHGVTIEAGPVTRHGGAGAGTYFRDPDGSLLEFIVYATD